MDTGIYGFLNEGIFYVYYYTAHQSTGHIHVCMSSAEVFWYLGLKSDREWRKIKVIKEKCVTEKVTKGCAAIKIQGSQQKKMLQQTPK